MKYILLLVSLCFVSQLGFSQEDTVVKGIVISTTSDAPLESVNIVNLNQVVGTSSDDKGAFQIKAKANDTLHFSYLGYKSIKVRVTNDWLKFGKLHDYAKSIGAEFVASGHHAQILQGDDGAQLHMGADDGKDQSYVLFGASRDRIGEMMLPIGHLQKSEVRDLAKEFDLPVFNKPDSQEICFVPDDNYANLIAKKTPGSMQQGDVLDADGNVIGKHEGQQKYTIGQRRGLGIAMSKPVYVVDKDPVLNTVTIGGEALLDTNGVIAKDTNWLVDKSNEWIPCSAKIRYNTPPALGKVRAVGQSIEVQFDEPQRGGAPGQAVVCYQDTRVICGGWIEKVS